MGSSFSLSDSSIQNLFKHKYADISTNMYNGKNVILGRVRKSYNAVGDQIERALPLGFQGGGGFGSLPYANRGNYGKAILTTKKVYAVCEIDRRTKQQSKSEGAFVDGMKESVKKTVEKFNWLMSFGLFHSGNGAMGTIDTSGVTDNTGGNYSIIISSATFKKANWEIRDYVNVSSGNTDLFEITAVAPLTRTITIQRISGSKVPVAADVVYLQGSQNNTITSIRQALDATSSTLYGQTVAYHWQSYQKSTTAGINVDMINEVMLETESQSGEVPNLFVLGYTQMRKLLNQLEDQKRYPTETKVNSRYGDFSFNAVQIMTSAGPVPIVVERFMENDRAYALNDEFIEIVHAPETPGWIDDEGFVFLRKANDDAYEARYGAYLENYTAPTPHAEITGLAT